MNGRGSVEELPKAYDPSMVEAEITGRWRAARVGAAPSVVEKGQSRYSIVIPPPNVTAALHLGHALNNTLQDVLIRYHRMKGDKTLWMPGTDHAGIATQTVVEKRLLAEGIRRVDLGREAFVAKTQEWKDEYEAVIIDQLLAMGASCDWDRTRFTMDEMCATAVRHAFYQLFADGLIYRGKRLVNWDPATQTALSDDEVEMEDVAGHMWYLRYPLDDGSGHVTVATTRPETMLGDTAVAVNPADPRAAGLQGKLVRLPIVDRLIPIVEDDYVVMADPDAADTKAQYATGFLKVTPAHDPNDWDIGVRKSLDVINVMGPDGAISADHGWDDVSDEARRFVGLSREEARAEIVAWFDAHGMLEGIRDYRHSVGHSYRSHVPVEPWLSDQWFVAVTDDRLRGSALRAQNPDQSPPLPDGVAPRSDHTGDGAMTFHPDRYARTYHAWHANIRDWCISRQLWWGHRIPVWLRVRPLAEADDLVRAALDGAGIDEPRTVDSEWIGHGAIHQVRRITEHELEEVVCVAPQATMTRLDGVTTTEEELVERLEAAGYKQDPDVLDTWFSSGLWPMSTMGWPWPEDHPDAVGLLESYNPTSVLMTAREIITLWVSRMVMFNRYFLDGRLPFEDVFIHAMIQDGHGQKMSKSLGNGLDPRDIIHSHGADALRFTLVQMTTDTQDVRMPVDMICPYTGESFTPEYMTTPAGHVVAAPIQSSPSDPDKQMVSAYGVAVGHVEPSDELPLARNTSPKFDLGRNFANKVWNATRFALGRISPDLDGGVVDPSASAGASDGGVTFVDRWIITRLAQTIDAVESALGRYQFNLYAETLYDFIWRDVCDRYLEAVKPTIDDNPSQQVVLGAVLDSALRLLHPVAPFVTEALWSHVSAVRSGDIKGVHLPSTPLVATAAWPAVDDSVVDPTIVPTFDRADQLVGQIRTIRSERNVKPKQQITVHAPGPVRALIAEAEGTVETLAGVAEVLAIEDHERPPGASPLAFEGHEVLISGLVDALDVDAERARLQKLIDGKSTQITGFEKRLANPGYINNAKPELVAETRELLEVARKDLAAAEAALAALSSA
jgi:valyl-tRNA synthetase